MNVKYATGAFIAVVLGLAVAADSRASGLPSVSSANLTYHLDAGDMNNDGGATNPGDGNNITSWTELIAGVSVNVQSTPWWRASGLSGNPSVRFDGGPPYGDLVYSNNPAIINTQAQTIIGVAGMTSDAYVLSDLISNSSGTSTIRQTTSETAAYYPGNSADFHFGGGGSFTINGNPTYTIPGGFGAAHVVKSIRPSPINIYSLRIGDNANNRLWSGDVAEVLVYDGKLSADDTALVHKYLIDKYGIDQVVDAPIANSSQVATDPFGDGTNRHVGVNFHYGGPTVGATFQGIGFDNVNLAGAAPPPGPFTLNANAATAGATLALSFPFTSDNGQRTQNAGIAGADAATLNAVANEMFYLGGTHPNALMTFAGLEANRDVYVQVLGGDSGWNGDLQVTANGTPIDADWTTVANGSGSTGSLYGFFAATDGSGQLQLDFSISAGNYAGIGGMVITQQIPEPSTLTLTALGLLGLLGWGRRRRFRIYDL